MRNLSLLLFTVASATSIPDRPAHACAIEYSTMEGPSFPADGAIDLPLNPEFFIFPTNDAAPLEGVQVLVSLDDGTLHGEAQVQYEGSAFRIKPVDLLPHTSYILTFPVHPDWDAPAPGWVPQGGFWRGPIVFATGDYLDEMAPEPGNLSFTLATCPHFGCWDGDPEVCGPWRHTFILPRVHVEVEADGFVDESQVGFRVWSGGGARSYWTSAGQGWPLLAPVSNACSRDNAGSVHCDEPLPSVSFEVEAFDTAGNTWWSETFTPDLTELDGYDQIQFPEQEPEPAPAEPEPTPAEPEPEPKEFEPPPDRENGCSSVPVATLFPLWMGLLAWRTGRRRGN